MRQQEKQEKRASSEDLAAPAVGYIMRLAEREKYQDCASFARRVLAAHGISVDAGMLGALYAAWRHEREQEQQGKEANKS